MNRRTFTLMPLFSAFLAALTAKRATAQGGQGDFGGLRRRLGLSDEQQKQIQQLYRDSDRRKRDLDERLNKLYSELDRLYDRYEFDSARVRAVTDEITELRRRSLTVYMDNEERLRRIITREQFDRLREFTKVRRGERENKERDRKRD